MTMNACTQLSTRVRKMRTIKFPLAAISALFPCKMRDSPIRQVLSLNFTPDAILLRSGQLLE